jgi:hypothetical protein
MITMETASETEQRSVKVKKNRHAPLEDFLISKNTIAIIAEIMVQLLSGFATTPPADDGYRFGNDQIGNDDCLAIQHGEQCLCSSMPLILPINQGNKKRGISEKTRLPRFLFFLSPQIQNRKTRYLFKIFYIIGKNSVQPEIKAMLCNDCIIYPDF